MPRLSPLQAFIIKFCYENFGNKKISRKFFVQFYDIIKQKPEKTSLVKIITKSLERLIDRGFLLGYGVRTPKKWFISEVKLTPLGLRLAKKLIGEQLKFAFHK